MITDSIEHSEIEQVLDEPTSAITFASALQRIQNDRQLLCVLGRYVHINSIFAGCVTNLAAELAARQDLFRDPAEPSLLLGDSSIDVAAQIFSAAIDEFG